VTGQNQAGGRKKGAFFALAPGLKRHTCKKQGCLMSKSAPHALILVENLPVPFDRRVWQEAQTLRDAGYKVSVICPKGKGHDAGHETIDGIAVWRHPLFQAKSAKGYLLEYPMALICQLWLSLRVRLARGRIDVIQACSPPDLLFLVALPHWLCGTRFIFDHHDLSPELFISKFGRRGFFYKMLCFFERRTFAMASTAIATNETFRDIAIARGGMDPDRVFVVKSYPRAERFKRTGPDPALVVAGQHLVGYIGIMGAQDGVNTLVDAMHEIRHACGRDDIACLIIGDGPELPALQAQTTRLGLDDSVTFTGYLSGPALMAHLSALDLGIIPDPPNEFNNKLSMNKVFEYMMMGLPFVQFDLTQARAEAGGAAVIINEHSAAALAQAIIDLADDSERRAAMGRLGQEIAAREFQWSREAARYLEAYVCALAPRKDRMPAASKTRS
jgi:glycosyltransferase involved in cell wall biosynthesis